MLKTATYTRSTDTPCILTLRGSLETTVSTNSKPRTRLAGRQHPSAVDHSSRTEERQAGHNFREAPIQLPTQYRPSQTPKRELRNGNENPYDSQSTKPLNHELWPTTSEYADRAEPLNLSETLAAESDSLDRQRLSRYLGEILDPAFQVSLLGELTRYNADTGDATRLTQSEHRRQNEPAIDLRDRQLESNSDKALYTLQTPSTVRSKCLTSSNNGQKPPQKFSYLRSGTHLASELSSSYNTCLVKPSSLANGELASEARICNSATDTNHQRHFHETDHCTSTCTTMHVHTLAKNASVRPEIPDGGQLGRATNPVHQRVSDRACLYYPLCVQNMPKRRQEVIGCLQNTSHNCNKKPCDNLIWERHSRETSEADLIVMYTGIATAKKLIAIPAKHLGEPSSALRPRVINLSNDRPRPQYCRNHLQVLVSRSTRQVPVSLKA